jgi:hypothetical protein
MAKPVKRKVEGGRVTGKANPAAKAPATGGRYTPPVPREFKISPRWVPVLMLVLLGLGVLIILLNYVGIVPGIGPLPDDTSNWYLLIGLALILGGIITATQWH